MIYKPPADMLHFFAPAEELFKALRVNTPCSTDIYLG